MESMRPEEVQAFVARTRFGMLGLAKRGHAYVVPLFYGYDGRRFYFHSNPGLKDDYREATEEACLAIVNAQSEDVWTSVLAFGPMGPVVDATEQLVAMDALMHVPLPPEFGFSKFGEPIRDGSKARLWKLDPREVTGRKSVRPG